jgi:hypothetical protein
MEPPPRTRHQHCSPHQTPPVDSALAAGGSASLTDGVVCVVGTSSTVGVSSVTCQCFDACFELPHEGAALVTDSRDHVSRAPSRSDLDVKRLPQIGDL